MRNICLAGGARLWPSVSTSASQVDSPFMTAISSLVKSEIGFRIALSILAATFGWAQLGVSRASNPSPSSILTSQQMCETGTSTSILSEFGFEWAGVFVLVLPFSVGTWRIA